MDLFYCTARALTVAPAIISLTSFAKVFVPVESITPWHVLVTVQACNAFTAY